MEFCTEIKSTKKIEEYARLGSVPRLTEWIDERKKQGLNEYEYQIKNKDYEVSISVDRNDLEDDQTGSIAMRVKQMTTSVGHFYNEEAVKALELGDSTVCYDGQNFFDTNHTDPNQAPQSNLISGPTAVLSATTLKKAIALMDTFKDDKGKIAWSKATHIAVPSVLERKAKELLDPAMVNGSANPGDRTLAGRLKYIVLPRLDGSDWEDSPFYVLDLSQQLKPIIFQNRKAPTLTSLDSDTSEEVFERKKLKYGVDLRCNFGYGERRTAIKVKKA